MSDWNETEEYDLLLKQLPEFYQIRVGQEEAKKKKGKFWVKVTNLTGVTTLDVQTEFSEILGGRVGGGRGDPQRVFGQVRVGPPKAKYVGNGWDGGEWYAHQGVEG